MHSHLEQDAPPDTTSLLRGIVHDAQNLVQQQLKLFQVEVKNDARRTIQAVIPIIVGAVVCLVAAIMLAIMAAQALVWVWPQLPTWGAYGIVGGVLATAGLAGVLAGKARFQTFNPLPDQTLEGLKENLQWKTKP